MNLLLYSHFFTPSIGGTETIVLSIARGLAELRTSSGLSEFEITLVTQTPAEHFDDRPLPFQVLRQPRLTQLWRLIRSSDIIHVAGPALSPLVFGLILRKPVVIEHHGFSDDLSYRPVVYREDGCPVSGPFYGWTPRGMCTVPDRQQLASLWEALVIDVRPTIRLHTRCGECRSNGMARWSSSPAKYNLNSSRHRAVSLKSSHLSDAP